ncbi:MAG: 50S ribosomal protein L4 [SAR324 cluster bacterium]|uniref:Large ribosomal subunit protein uL4 n=1 Tax=SAR324 cluster bacterium TaxID=2024889 RepID=A0A2A4TC25_9DELT|nr:MAG: 50S ribosomal protein L4 [SAR324 cluster bacterium]
MASLKVYSLENQEVGTVDLHDDLAQATLNPFIVKDTVVSYLNGLRQGTHKTKERSEVTGSRRKLFRQKGTGNARAGSAQSPVRRHGATVFGPTPRSYKTDINKKVKKKALASVLSEKLKNGQLLIVDNLKLEDHKTKKFLAWMETMNLKKTLFVSSEQDSNFELASRNVTFVKSVHASGLNVYDVLNHTNLVMTKQSLMDVEGRLLK